MRIRKTAAAITLAFALAAVPASSQAYTTGIGDQQAAMFASPLYRALHVRIARYIAPYDAADVPYDRSLATNWLNAAARAHVQPLVAFYHSRVSPTRQPSAKKYLREIKRFMALFPQVRVYSAWNEANRGNVRETGGGSFHSPTATQSAQYYLALRSACKHCKIVGLDVLDSNNINATLRYIRSFRHAVGRHQPSIWGLHNYSDTNRFRNKGTKAVLRAVGGQVWLTETGGVVKFGVAFPRSTGRAAKALKYMFKLAKSDHRLTRLYIFAWTGGDSSARFDAGLTNPDGSARPGYFAVRKQLIGR